MFEESPGPIEKYENETPSMLGLKMKSEEAGNTAEIAVMPSVPAKPEEMIFSFRSDLTKKFLREYTSSSGPDVTLLVDLSKNLITESVSTTFLPCS